MTFTTLQRPAVAVDSRSRKPVPVTPRFKTGAPAPAAAVLLPDVRPAFTPAWYGFEPPHDPARYAEGDRRYALAALLRLREEAAVWVETLLIFLDETNGAEDFELDDSDDEPAGDELDASYPEGGERLLSYPDEDAEDIGDFEPHFVPMVSRGAA